ncbi:MAG: hypothetical protein WCP70_08045 [Methanothrix sp.]
METEPSRNIAHSATCARTRACAGGHPSPSGNAWSEARPGGAARLPGPRQPTSGPAAVK